MANSKAPGMTIAQMLQYDPSGETYGFVHDDKHNVTHVAVGALKRLVAAYNGAFSSRPLPLDQCAFSDTLTGALERNELGVEIEHALTLSDEALKQPVIVGIWGADKHILLDGAHRLWRVWKRGDQTFPAYVVPEYVWREFVVVDMPGDAAFWDEFNRTARIRTPELEALRRILFGEI